MDEHADQIETRGDNRRHHITRYRKIFKQSVYSGDAGKVVEFKQGGKNDGGAATIFCFRSFLLYTCKLVNTYKRYEHTVQYR